MIEFSTIFEGQQGVLDDERQVLDYCHRVIGLPALFVMETLLGSVSGDHRRDALEVSELIQLANITRDIEKDLRAGGRLPPRPQGISRLEWRRSHRRCGGGGPARSDTAGHQACRFLPPSGRRSRPASIESGPRRCGPHGPVHRSSLPGLCHRRRDASTVGLTAGLDPDPHISTRSHLTTMGATGLDPRRNRPADDGLSFGS